MNIDIKDQEILNMLQQNARLPLSTMARRLNMSRSTLQARLERLENSGVIAGYSVRFGEAFEAKRIYATVLARIASGGTQDILAQLRKFQEIERASTCSGRFDLIVELAVQDLAKLDEIIDELEAIEGFENSETLVHLTRRLDRRI